MISESRILNVAGNFLEHLTKQHSGLYHICRELLFCLSFRFSDFLVVDCIIVNKSSPLCSDYFKMIK